MTEPRPNANAAGSVRWLLVVGIVALMAASLGLGGLLGTWQWQRAHQQAKAVEPEPLAPIAEVMVPGEPGRGEGRLVSVSGAWADADVAVVTGKHVDGHDAVLLIRAFTVAADATGTGQQATLAVLSGWLPADEVPAIPAAGASEELTGYVRGGEGSVPGPSAEAPPGAFLQGSMSTAALAQRWPAPVYSYLVVADQPAPGWNPLPAPQPKSHLDLRSVTYAIEWWLFGGFGAILGARAIRDNGRIRPHLEVS